MRLKPLSRPGVIPILFLIAGVGLVAFFAVSFIAPFKDNLFDKLFPKSKTGAVSVCEKAPVVSFGQKPDKEKAKSTADNLNKSTAELVDKHKQFKQESNGGKRDELIALAKVRKPHLVETIYRDPDAALNSILPANNLSELQLIAPGCVETRAEFEGTLEVLHV